MSAVIIFISVGLFVYWVNRTGLILYGSRERIRAVLDHDIRTFDDVMLALRATFFPSTISMSI